MLRAGFSVKKAHAIQLRLSERVIREDTLPRTLRYVAGVDVAYVGDLSIAAVAVLDYSSLSLVEAQKVAVKTQFPYIPTLLSWREIRPAKAAIRKLKTRPDVFLVDAQGIAHPYRLGFASHLGVLLDKPTIGVAKSLLCGQIGSPNQQGWMPITDKREVIGAAIKRDEKTQPIYVSVGHGVSLERAIEIARHCTKSARIPEPIRIAHTLASEEKRKHKQEITHQSKKRAARRRTI
jgi:deoxyribonuclease V